MGTEQIKKRLKRASYNFSHRSAKFHELNRFRSMLSGILSTPLCPAKNFG